VTEPVTVDAAQFFDFIGGPGLKAVLLSVHPTHTFSRALCQQLVAEHETIACGTIGLDDLVVSGGAAVPFLMQEFRRCGAPSMLGIAPGYCLFRGSEMLAWEAGLPALADLGGIFRGTLLGVIWSAVTNDLSFVARALQFAADYIAAQRVAERFRHAASNPSQRRQTGASTPPPVDDVSWAYQILGVSPSATDREVHHAWRRMRIENHPDLAGSDRVEFERRSRISADINRARDIITDDRARGSRREWAA
jgi:DnaJ-like protein